MAIIPSWPTFFSMISIHFGCMNQQFMMPMASYSCRGMRPDSPSVARAESASHSFQV